MRRATLTGLVVIAAVAMLDTSPAKAQATWGPSAWIGSTGGQGPGDLACPAGKYAIGIQVRAGIYIHEILLECARLGANGEHQEPVMVRTTNFKVQYRGDAPTLQRRCSSGRVMVGVQGRSAEWIDAIRVGCKAWSRAGGGTQGTTSWSTSAGGTGGNPYGPLSCPGQYGIYKVQFWGRDHIMFRDLVHGFAFWCKAA